MPKPIIGISSAPFKTEHSQRSLSEIQPESAAALWRLMRLFRKIEDGVLAAGGIPVALSVSDSEDHIETIADKLDGFIFSGGASIDPSFYGEENKSFGTPDTKRDAFEISLAQKVIAQDKPLLGICRGCQLLNVACGGNLIQHLPDLNPEWKLHYRPDVLKGTVHEVKILVPELFAAKNDTINVNSIHRQCAGRLGKGLQKAAATEDGITEAIFRPDTKFTLGIQWHPECLFPKDEVQMAIFKSFVGAAER